MKHNNCPSSDFELGEPSGKCNGDGHYMCKKCKHFNFISYLKYKRQIKV